MSDQSLPLNEVPVGPSRDTARFGSDVIADVLRSLDIPFIALNPGASYRGLHDSLVNYLGNENPKMLLCLHEEHAVAIAQGWAKVTGRPMAVALHSNVGLMHASMAIYNAWCDRMPMLILGATGAVDAMQRRPWIEWIHTSRDQAALVRDFVKWDDQPASVGAARESIYRAAWLTNMAPRAPVYVVLGVELQEHPSEALPSVDPRRFMPAVRSGVDHQDVSSALDLLRGAARPLILAGRLSRSLEGWQQRIRLAETLRAPVATDTRVAAAFPTGHPLHVGALGTGSGGSVTAIREAVRTADVILCLDWLDLAGLVKTALSGDELKGKVIHVSLDHVLHNGWSFDHMGLPEVDLMVAADPDVFVSCLVDHLADRPEQPATIPIPELPSDAVSGFGPIRVTQLATVLRQAVEGRDVSLLQVPLSWDPASWPFNHPLDYLGSDGGGGIGSGPGLSVGAALALRGQNRLPIAVFGDGNFAMGSSAIWTAAHYGVPLLIVVANNQSFYNDELHQERMALQRNRPVENKWIGQRMTEPELDIATIARGHGAIGLGPVHDLSELPGVLEQALRHLDAGSVVVVDVRVLPGYAT